MIILETINERAETLFKKEKQRLTELNLSQQELIEWAASFSTQQILLQAALNTFVAAKINTSLQQNDTQENQSLLEGAIEHLRKEVIHAASNVNALHAKKRKDIGTYAANQRHKDIKAKHEHIRQLWASGNYESRKSCAELEHEKLGVGFEAARDALKGTPDPVRGGC